MSALRYALRSLWKAKSFSLIAIATLALGIGANTAVFSIVDAVLLRPLPFGDAARLMTLAGVNPKRGVSQGAFSYPAFRALEAQTGMVGGIAAVATEQFNQTGSDMPEQISGGRVSASFFDLIGVPMAAGRSFLPADDRPGAQAVVIVGRRYWTARFASAAAPLGRSLTLNGAPYAAVGALGIDLPPPFDGVDLWATHVDEISSFTPQQVNGGLGYLTAVVRLAPGRTLAETQAHVDAAAHAYARENPTNTDADPVASLQLVPIRERTAGPTRSPLLVMVAAVGLVLLIACANVANLLLVRAAARAHETAVRAALGATRWHLIRWSTAESLVLTFAGGLAGVVLALWTVDAAAGLLTSLPRSANISVDARALVFSLAVSLLAGLLFGVVPSLRATSFSPADALRGTSRSSTMRRGRSGSVLVVAEVALSLMLLVGAALLLQTFVRLVNVPLGFTPDGLVSMRISLPTSTYADPATMRAFMNRLMPRLQATSGVAGAAATMGLPPRIPVMAPYLLGDRPEVPIGERPIGQWAAVTPSYFSTMQIRLVEGRLFTDRDNETAPFAVIVNETLARRAWPDDRPLGKRLIAGRSQFSEVVGVVADVKNGGPADEVVPEMYTPYAQRPWPAMTLVVRAVAGDPLALVPAVRAAVRQTDPDQPITQVETLDQALAGSVATTRLLAALLTSFALVAVAMAAAGLYGVIAYSVEQRTREIGVRVALGANASSVLRLITGDGFLLTAAGVALGTLLAAVASRAIRSVLFEVSPGDPLTYLGVIAIFALVAAAACIVPARRALRVDPIVALRSD